MARARAGNFTAGIIKPGARPACVSTTLHDRRVISAVQRARVSLFVPHCTSVFNSCCDKDTSSVRLRLLLTHPSHRKMPRIKVEQPSAAAIKDNARAFALLHQLDPSSEGTVDASVRLPSRVVLASYAANDAQSNAET